MKDNPIRLILLRVAAGVAVLTGLVWTGQSLAHLGQATDLYRKKISDIRELSTLRQTVLRYRRVLTDREQMASPLTPLAEVLRTAL
ncbi:MAG: hypothetical protein WCS01_05295, partial [bacterium]